MNNHIQQIVTEFQLGTLIHAVPLSGGAAGVLKLATTQGDFVVKPAPSLRELVLY